MKIFCKVLLAMAAAIIPFNLMAQEQAFVPAGHRIIKSERSDGRYISSRGIVHSMLKNTSPKYAFKPSMDKDEFVKWQHNLRIAMKDLMRHPEVKGQPSPKMISRESRNGYAIEKWEFYPLPDAVSTFLVLIPNNLSNKEVPAIMCIPGSSGCKEYLAGEAPLSPRFEEDYRNGNTPMALQYVKMGLIAVVVDNAAAGEASDLEKYASGLNFDYESTARYLLELGWHYLGYTSFLNMTVLDWMKQDDRIDKNKLIVSGFSLGTEPMMVLASMDTSIYAFVYNDFLCNTEERAIVMTEPDINGVRPTPNSIRHLIPGFWNNFNFPDIVASFAPRPLILTEGGLDRDLDLVKRAYEITGRPDNIEIHHYAKFSDPKSRTDLQQLPEGLGRDQYYNMVNVDPANHYFKADLIIPWLKKILTQDK